MSVLCKPVAYGGWRNCLSLSDGNVELIITLDVGPRIIKFSMVDQPNIFKEFPDLMGKTGGDEWVNFGGHRLWHAPEIMPRTYEPDNSPVRYDWADDTLTLYQDVEPNAKIEKTVKIKLDNTSRVTIEHILTNRNLWEIETAAWALTVLEAGGRAILPQEPFVPFPEALLPARPLILWQYTNMADPRFEWQKDYIRIQQSSSAADPQKIGLRNSLGWGAYEINGTVFIKKTPLDPLGKYPDFGSNWEIYTDADMLELETLSPLTKIAPDHSISHTETWDLISVEKDLSSTELFSIISKHGLTG